jgi:VWFA-related protein
MTGVVHHGLVRAALLCATLPAAAMMFGLAAPPGTMAAAPIEQAASSAPPPESSQSKPSGPAGGQPVAPGFRTGAAGVSIDVLVTERDRPAPGLTAADFELTDNGVPQDVDVTIVKDRAIDVLLAFDTSPSLGVEGLRHLIGATDTLLAGLTARDRAALVTCSQAVVIRQTLTADFARLRDIMRRLTLFGRTAIADAVYAATTLQEAPDRPALLLVFSDGVDNASWLSDAEVFETVRRHALVPYAVAVVPRTPDGRPFPGGGGAADLFLKDLVEIGGGQLIRAEKTEEVERHFAVALDNFRQRYLLTYTPRGVDGSGWHAVAVKSKNRRHHVRARAGYFVR